MRAAWKAYFDSEAANGGVADKSLLPAAWNSEPPVREAVFAICGYRPAAVEKSEWRAFLTSELPGLLSCENHITLQTVLALLLR